MKITSSLSLTTVVVIALIASFVSSVDATWTLSGGLRSLLPCSSKNTTNTSMPMGSSMNQNMGSVSAQASVNNNPTDGAYMNKPSTSSTATSSTSTSEAAAAAKWSTKSNTMMIAIIASVVGILVIVFLVLVFRAGCGAKSRSSSMSAEAKAKMVSNNNDGVKAVDTTTPTKPETPTAGGIATDTNSVADTEGTVDV
jgi:hypothetical protein